MTALCFNDDFLMFSLPFDLSGMARNRAPPGVRGPERARRAEERAKNLRFIHTVVPLQHSPKRYVLAAREGIMQTVHVRQLRARTRPRHGGGRMTAAPGEPVLSPGAGFAPRPVLIFGKVSPR
jgi:hypothetical protein